MLTHTTRGFLVISVTSFIFTFPNGILWGVANTQIGMAYLSEGASPYLTPTLSLSLCLFT